MKIVCTCINTRCSYYYKENDLLNNDIVTADKLESDTESSVLSQKQILWLKRLWLLLKLMTALDDTKQTRLPLTPVYLPSPHPPPHILPPHRKKHISTLLNIRGMMRQAERQEILNIVKDFECSSALMCRDHALFSDIPITSEVHCISLGILRLAMTVSNWFSEHRPRRNHRTSARNATPQSAENIEDKLHRED